MKTLVLNPKASKANLAGQLRYLNKIKKAVLWDREDHLIDNKTRLKSYNIYTSPWKR